MKKTDSQCTTAGEFLRDTLREPKPEHSALPLSLSSPAPTAPQARHALTATKHCTGTCPWLKRQLTCPPRRMGWGKRAMPMFCAVPLAPYNIYSWSCPLVCTQPSAPRSAQIAQPWSIHPNPLPCSPALAFPLCLATRLAF